MGADIKLTPPFVECRWFALCDNFATSIRPHPILGDVPICERCDHIVAWMNGEAVAL